MDIKSQRPKLWSDFDGTAVVGAPALSPRNIVKYPLSVMPGYVDFLKSIQKQGLDVGGVVTRRPNLWARRAATGRTMRSHGLGLIFGSSVVHAGSERAKARFVVEQSRSRTIVMLEDRPQYLGFELVQILGQSAETDRQSSWHPIVLGIAPNKHSDKRIQRLVDRLHKQDSSVLIKRVDKRTIVISAGPSTLHIMRLRDYSDREAAMLASYARSIDVTLY